MSVRNTLFAVGALALAGSVSALDPNCAPGGNFNLKGFTLQLPVADSDGGITQIPGDQLDGCDNGFQDFDHFFTESKDGALVMKTPGSSSGCPQTSGSQHCRTELRESDPDNWDPTASTNRLAVDLVGTGGSDVCIGQVFQVNPPYSKPYVELYYQDSGRIYAGVEYEAKGGSQDPQEIGNVPLNTPFSYELRYEGGELSVGLNGEFKTLNTYFQTPGAYFKVGNYNQGDDDSDVHFFNITVTHS